MIVPAKVTRSKSLQTKLSNITPLHRIFISAQIPNSSISLSNWLSFFPFHESTLSYFHQGTNPSITPPSPLNWFPVSLQSVVLIHPRAEFIYTEESPITFSSMYNQSFRVQGFKFEVFTSRFRSQSYNQNTDQWFILALLLFHSSGWIYLYSQRIHQSCPSRRIYVITVLSIQSWSSMDRDTVICRESM